MESVEWQNDDVKTSDKFELRLTLLSEWPLLSQQQAAMHFG